LSFDVVKDSNLNDPPTNGAGISLGAGTADIPQQSQGPKRITLDLANALPLSSFIEDGREVAPSNARA
jgi:hypothetical protein